MARQDTDILITSIITRAMGIGAQEIGEIKVLKKGMTNQVFTFRYNEKKYLLRVPGKGANQLVDRRKEASVYHTIRGKGLSDDVIYIDPKTGYKISEFLENARTCDPHNGAEVAKCMEKLRSIHEMELKVDHEFDLFRQIDFYESLWEGKPSIYADYRQTKEKVFSLRRYIGSHIGKKVLSHIDPVADNFLIIGTGDKEDIRLIDWEYSGMQDPHVDVAMFCIYALYDKQGIDRVIKAYFPEGCPEEIRIKIYCYISVCGLLWSNWCEYKRNLGAEFGEYALKQYDYAKNFFRNIEKVTINGER